MARAESVIGDQSWLNGRLGVLGFPTGWKTGWRQEFSVFQLVGKLKCSVRLLGFREIEFLDDAVVVRCAIDAVATEERLDALLLLGRNGIFAFAKEVVTGCAAEDGVQAFAQ